MMTLVELRGILPGALCEVLWMFSMFVVLCFVSALCVKYCAFLVCPLACVEGAAIVQAFFVATGLLHLGFFAFFSVAAMRSIHFIRSVTLLLHRCRRVRNLETTEIRGDEGSKILLAKQLRYPESAGAFGHKKSLFYAAVKYYFDSFLCLLQFMMSFPNISVVEFVPVLM